MSTKVEMDPNDILSIWGYTKIAEFIHLSSTMATTVKDKVDYQQNREALERIGVETAKVVVDCITNYIEGTVKLLEENQATEKQIDKFLLDTEQLIEEESKKVEHLLVTTN